MQETTTQNLKIKSSEKDNQKETTFFERFTCESIFKIFYLFFSVSFGHGIFALIIYFMANKKYGIVLTIGAIFSGVLHFLYECYKILYNEEILTKQIILKNKLKTRLINDKKLEYYMLKYNY
jgi:hypothetical protein